MKYYKPIVLEHDSTELKFSCCLPALLLLLLTVIELYKLMLIDNNKNQLGEIVPSISVMLSPVMI